MARDRAPQADVLEWRRQMLRGFGGALEALRAADAMDVGASTGRVPVVPGPELSRGED